MRIKDLDLEAIAEKLDITPTMYKYAVDRYESIAQYLDDSGVHADFYPQGSFRTGTVVRPLKSGIESDYDLDVMCTLTGKKELTTAREVKNTVGDALSANATYRSKLLPEDSRCWTLEYSGVSEGIGFSLDIVPSVHESQSIISDLTDDGVPYVLASEAVSITEKINSASYRWISSNPKGFADWFDSINKPFSDYNFESRRRAFFEKHRSQFRADAQVEEVPVYHVKSSLQRVIQLLKRHRDLFFHRAQADNLRPASVIITALAANSARSAPSSYAVDELLQHIAYDLRDYIALLKGDKPKERHDGEQRLIIQRKSGKWIILNPVNPRDNFADSWTDETASMFFRWINSVVSDLADIHPTNESNYLSALRRSFGTKVVDSSLRLYDTTSKVTSPITTPTRPWSNID